MLKKLIIALLLIINCQWLNVAHAADLPIRQALRVSPIIINADLIVGRQQDYEIKIENILDVPLGIKTSLSPLDSSDEDNGISFEKPISNNKFISSISVSDNEDILEPHEIKTIKLSINTPKDITTDQINAILFITPFITKPIDTSTPTVVSKIGILILGNFGTVNPTDLKEKAKIITSDFGFITETPKYVLRVQNNYSKTGSF